MLTTEIQLSASRSEYGVVLAFGRTHSVVGG